MKDTLGTILLLVLALLASSLHGATTGQIKGVITEEDTGHPVVGATIHLLNTHLGDFSDKNGRFTVYRVKPGQYTLRASMIGYWPVEVTNVVVMSDSSSIVNVKLSKQPSDLNILILKTKPVTPSPPPPPPPPPVSRQEVQAMMPLYHTYFRIWRSLANDDLAGAKKELSDLAKITKSIELSRYGDHAANRFLTNRQSIIALTEAGLNADSMEDFRKGFRTLSRTIASIHRVFGHLGDNYYYRVSCSVFGSGPCHPRAYWFQESDVVRNPLYGGEFLCDGLVEDSLKPTDAAILPIFIVEGE